ncbi:DUF4377 domain-containing protein [Fulvivirga ligni]|uniref:DUF4377 domain-containing protein n=1 Tax=Fulvivirga ligni TaxID=2904246 RepID=UPI001F160D8C|nr:DUF4377 domain-containing protein [Fulvivirga ligni]UII19667.1 DUF4377 domain-containing protein [Fulvivirga ligni]
MKTILLFAFTFFMVAACSRCEDDEVYNDDYNFRVNHYQVDCVGEGPQKCFLVQQGSKLDTEEWDLFYGNIENFEFTSGYVYNLQIEKTEIKNPPADGSSIKYSLIKIISRQKT